MLSRAAVLAVVVACGGAAEPLQQPEPPQRTTPKPVRPPAASVEQCDRLLDHMIDLEFRKFGGPPDPASKQAVIDSKRDEFHAACVDQTPAHSVECALAARDLDGIAKCDEAP